LPLFLGTSLLATKRKEEKERRVEREREEGAFIDDKAKTLFGFWFKTVRYLGHVWVQFLEEFKNENQAQNFQNCLWFAPLIVTPTSCKTRQKNLMIKYNSSMKLRTTKHLLQINPMQNVNNLLLKNTTNLVITLFNQTQFFGFKMQLIYPHKNAHIIETIVDK
jgi:hypothetical protein